MKKVVVGLIVILILLAGCGNSEEKKIKEVNENIMVLANIAILEEKLSGKMGEDADYTNTIKTLRSGADYSDHEYEKEMNNKLADMLEKGDLRGVKKLYVELGGELEEDSSNEQSSNEESFLDSWETENDKKFGVMSLHTAHIFLAAEFEVEDEDRERVASMITSNRMMIKEESRSSFDELADSIKENDQEKANTLFEELSAEYIPSDKLKLFDSLGELSSQEAISAVIEEIVK